MAFDLMAHRHLRKKGRKTRSEINVTSLIDVMMVLLVIFMVAAPLMTTGIQLDLPKVGGKSLNAEQTSINISVDKEGYYYIGENEIPAEEIVAKLEAIRQANKDISITISADTTAEYGRVIGLMAVLKEASFDKVGLKTEPSPNAGKKKKK